MPAEGVLAGEAVQVPADVHEVEARRVGDEDEVAGQGFQPSEIVVHGLFGRLHVLVARGPGFGLPLPPTHRLRVLRCAWKRFEVGREPAQEGLVRQVGRRADAEHRINAGDRPVRLHVRADVYLHVATPMYYKPDRLRPYRLTVHRGTRSLPSHARMTKAVAARDDGVLKVRHVEVQLLTTRQHTTSRRSRGTTCPRGRRWRAASARSTLPRLRLEGPPRQAPRDC